MPSIRIALVALLTLACSGPVETDLLDVHEISPDQVQPGHRLTLHGGGFPAGRPASVRFVGALHRPALAPRAIDVEVRGEAVADDRVEVVMSSGVLRQLGGRGTFRGSLRVAFGATALDVGSVVGSIDGAVLDLVPIETPATGRSMLAPRLGIELTLGEDDLPGVHVGTVAPGSRAALAGLLEGDRIVAIDGLRVLSPDELQPAPDATSVELELVRSGESASFVVPLALSGSEASTDSVRMAQAAALIWLAGLLLLGPGVSWLDRLTPNGRAVPWRMLLLAPFAALALRDVLERAPDLGIHAVLFAIVAGRIAVAVLGTSDARSRADAVVRGGASAVAASGTVLVIALLAGTTRTLELESAQGPWPSDWLALRSPAGFAAALMLTLVAASGPRVERASSRLRAIDDAFVIGIATCAMIALAGGASARIVIADLRPAWAWVGYAAFAAVASGIALLLRRARDVGANAPSGWLLATSVAVASVASVAALGWIELEVDRAIERAIAEVLVITAALIVVRVATARPRPAARPVHALL